MMSARGDLNGKNVVILGLTFDEVDHLRKNAMTDAIAVIGADIGLPEIAEIRIVVGESAEALIGSLQYGIDEHTVLRGLPEGMKN